MGAAAWNFLALCCLLEVAIFANINFARNMIAHCLSNNTQKTQKIGHQSGKIEEIVVGIGQFAQIEWSISAKGRVNVPGMVLFIQLK